jgi:hypothetical protein
MLSHRTSQQYGSAVHTSSAHELHAGLSFDPELHTEWLQVPPPPPPLLLPLPPPLLLPPPPVHDSPQYFGTSLTQMPSQRFWQQYGSFVHTSSAHVLHVVVSALPCEHTGCEQVPPPPLLDPELLPLLDPELLPLLEPLLDPELLPLELPLLDPELLPLLEPLLDPELLPLLEPPPVPVIAAPFGVPHPVGPS